MAPFLRLPQYFDALPRSCHNGCGSNQRNRPENERASRDVAAAVAVPYIDAVTI